MKMQVNCRFRILKFQQANLQISTVHKSSIMFSWPAALRPPFLALAEGWEPFDLLLVEQRGELLHLPRKSKLTSWLKARQKGLNFVFI